MPRLNGPTPPRPSEAPSEVPRRADVRWGGLTETQALEAILGKGQLTDDRRADLLRAMSEILDWLRRLDHRRGLILHGLYQEFLPDNEDVYRKIGEAIGQAAGVEDIPKSTIHRWSHPAVWESLRSSE
jgi:hypothetical protein